MAQYVEDARRRAVRPGALRVARRPARRAAAVVGSNAIGRRRWRARGRRPSRAVAEAASSARRGEQDRWRRHVLWADGAWHVR